MTIIFDNHANTGLAVTIKFMALVEEAERE